MSSDDVIDVLSVGCMPPETIVGELIAQKGYDTQEAKLAVTEAIEAGEIEEHPRFNECYRSS